MARGRDDRAVIRGPLFAAVKYRVSLAGANRDILDAEERFRSCHVTALKWVRRTVASPSRITRVPEPSQCGISPRAETVSSRQTVSRIFFGGIPR